MTTQLAIDTARVEARLEERATELQILLENDGIRATHQECVDLLIADLVEQILQKNRCRELDTVSS